MGCVKEHRELLCGIDKEMQAEEKIKCAEQFLCKLYKVDYGMDSVDEAWLFFI